MNGSITLDMTQGRKVICNATRNKPYAHARQIHDLNCFGDILAFVSEHVDKINDKSSKWGECD